MISCIFYFHFLIFESDLRISDTISRIGTTITVYEQVTIDQLILFYAYNDHFFYSQKPRWLFGKFCYFEIVLFVGIISSTKEVNTDTQVSTVCKNTDVSKIPSITFFTIPMLVKHHC